MTAHNPWSRSLKDVKLFNLRLDRRHELNRRRASTDHRNPTSLNLELVVPARGVKHFALEGFQAGELRQLGFAERTRGRDKKRSHEGSLGRLNPPTLQVAFPHRFGDHVSEADVRKHRVIPGALS